MLLFCSSFVFSIHKEESLSDIIHFGNISVWVPETPAVWWIDSWLKSRGKVECWDSSNMVRTWSWYILDGLKLHCFFDPTGFRCVSDVALHPICFLKWWMWCPHGVPLHSVSVNFLSSSRGFVLCSDLCVQRCFPPLCVCVWRCEWICLSLSICVCVCVCVVEQGKTNHPL